MIPLITIEGPTGSGKSDLALSLAQELGSEIISADSRQVYRHLDIGTAKPSTSELALVPHHLINIIDPNQSYNVGRFCADAESVINKLHSQDKIPIVCGGTGLYVSSLLRGIFHLRDIPGEIREGLKQRLSDEGLERLYSELLLLDPDFAANISSNDKQRILRGLEVHIATGISLSEHWSRQTATHRYRTFRILLDLPRPQLYQRINLRVQTMLDAGWLDEILKVLDMGFNVSAPGLNSLGYKELLPYITDGQSLEDCIAQTAQHTRNYAKRQCTWYRKHKFDLTLDSSSSIISSTVELIKARLY